MTKVTLEVVDMGVRYVHSNGRVLDIVGEASDGEWFVYADATDSAECLAQGFYEEDEEGEGTFYTTHDGLELNTGLAVAGDELELLAVELLEA
jgi:hypothetical protein